MQDAIQPASQPPRPVPQSASQAGTRIATGAECPKLIGYKQLRELYGWPKSTIIDWVRKRQFPKAAELPGRETQWFLDDVLKWLENRRQGLVASAIKHPEKLSPIEIERATFELAAKRVSLTVGSTITPDQIVLGYLQPVTEAEAHAELEQHFDAVGAIFEGLTFSESLAVIYWLFPAFRPTLNDVFEQHKFDWPADPDAWRGMAIGALLAARGRAST